MLRNVIDRAPAMDITPILIQAAATFGNSALGEAGKRAVGQAWEAAVAAIRRQFGAAHPAPALIESLRGAAGNEAQTAAIGKHLAAMNLGSDPAVAAAVEELSAALRQPQTTVTAHTIYGGGVVYGNVHQTFGKDH